MGRDEGQVHLPAEMLDLIFQLLPTRDLMVVVQVCSFWREVGEAPGLWSRGVICLARGNMFMLPEVLGARRMLLVRSLRVLDWPASEGLGMRCEGVGPFVCPVRCLYQVRVWQDCRWSNLARSNYDFCICAISIFPKF